MSTITSLIRNKMLVNFIIWESLIMLKTVWMPVYLTQKEDAWHSHTIQCSLMETLKDIAMEVLKNHYGHRWNKMMLFQDALSGLVSHLWIAVWMANVLQESAYVVKHGEGQDVMNWICFQLSVIQDTITWKMEGIYPVGVVQFCELQMAHTTCMQLRWLNIVE